MQAALLAGRRAAERLMVDACTISTVGAPSTDPVTGDVASPLTQVWSGRCKVVAADAQERTPQTAAATVTVQRYAVHVPVGEFAPAVGMVVDVTAATLDPHLAGRRFRVVALLHKTAATAYRLAVEEVTSG